MDSPIQVRFPTNTKKKLVRAGTLIGQSDVIRLAVTELFKKYPTNDAIFTAFMEARRAEAAK